MLQNTAARLGDRTLFPNLEPRFYLAHSAVSPVSEPVAQAVSRVLFDYQKKGLGAVPFWWEQKDELRRKLAEMLGTDGANVAFVPNTTRGVSDMALCIPWRAGDRIVLFDGEFPTNVTPWKQAAKTHDLTLEILPRPNPANVGDSLQQLEETLKRSARLVTVSAVQFQTGLRMPLDQIGTLCRRYNAELFVDAIQACGIVTIDVDQSGIDYLTSGSHKWMMGLEGCGFLYINPRCLAQLRPVVAGWLSHEDPLDFLFEGPGVLRYDKRIRTRADFVENGSPNTVGLAALTTSLGLLNQLGIPSIFDHVNDYLNLLEPGLVALGFESLRAPESRHRSGILSFRVPGDLAIKDLVADLAARGILATHPDGLLRLAPHWPNGLEEVADVLGIFEEICQEHRT